MDRREGTPRSCSIRPKVAGSLISHNQTLMEPPLRILRCSALTLFTILATIGSAGAQLQPSQKVVCTTPQILFGNGATFEFQGSTNGWATTSAVWEFQWVVNGCTTAWAPFNPMNYPISYPGSLTARCTLQYNDGSGGHTIKTQLATTITVPPPDGVRIASGDGVSANFGQYNQIVFQIQCRGRTVSI
jgi:hypothetical protein